MIILFIGDVVGEPGRRAVQQLLPRLREAHAVDVVVANGENAAGGSGITVAMANELYGAGVDLVTSGDHLWDQKDVLNLLLSEPRFIRPPGGSSPFPSGGCTTSSRGSCPGVEGGRARWVEVVSRTSSRASWPGVEGGRFRRAAAGLRNLWPGIVVEK